MILIVLAILFAGWMAYGVDPGWAWYSHGLGFIMLSRRVQWPLAALSLLLSAGVIGIVIGGKRRVWWLIGLAPVMVLFVHRYGTASVNRLAVVEQPAFVDASAAKLLDTDCVVGLEFSEQAYAYPYAALYPTPVVVQADRDERMVLVWCAHANSAFAAKVGREVKARELEIVSEPANALLLYNARSGQFINGFTGRTPAGDVPKFFFEKRMAVTKTTWAVWRSRHPQTRVMLPVDKVGPSSPLPPVEPVGRDLAGAPATTPVCLIATTRPVAVKTRELGNDPVNLSGKNAAVLVLRDPITDQLHCFDRHVEADLVPKFVLNRDKKRKAPLVDKDTNTGWSFAGVAVEGDASMFKRKLQPVEIHADVYWGVAKYWYPDIELVKAGS